MRATLFCLSILCLPLVAAADGTAFKPPIESLRYGVICDVRPDGTQPAPGTVSGILNLIDQDQDIEVVTVEVPADLGISFGIRAVPSQDMAPVVADVIVTHPPMGPEGQTVETWTTSLSGGDPSLNLFTFEEPFEQIQGPWRFQLRLGEEVILDQPFLVTPPGSVPVVQSACNSALILS